jgi:hypothetical protein
VFVLRGHVKEREECCAQLCRMHRRDVLGERELPMSKGVVSSGTFDISCSRGERCIKNIMRVFRIWQRDDTTKNEGHITPDQTTRLSTVDDTPLIFQP